MPGELQSFYDYLDHISYRGVKPGLERMHEALNLLGNPEKKLKVIHIAGTNGKGSVCSLIAQFLAVSGYSVGLSLSPHIYDYRERLQFYDQNTDAAQMISPQNLLQIHEELRAILPDSLELTYFEWSILLVIQFFTKAQRDVVVLETGLGGRLDGTNVCPSLLSGITTIGLDHVGQLGHTLSAILAEKQEIIKPHSHFLFGPKDEKLIQQVQAHCQKLKATYHHVSDFQKMLENDLEPVRKTLAHQPAYFYENFCFAYSLGLILEDLGFRMDRKQFVSLKEFHFPPARAQVINENPRIIIDGAHNEPGLKALKEFAKTELHDDYDLVFGCLNDRDFLHLAEMIASPKGENYWLKFEAGERTPPAQTYQDVVQKRGGKIVAFTPEFKENLRSANRTILVCGSLYLCAQFIAFWRSNDC